MCSHCSIQSSGYNLSASSQHVKKLCRHPLSGLTIDHKDSFESSEAGLFTSNNAKKADVYAILCAETSKNKKCRHTWTWRLLGRQFVLVCFRETIGKLATLIVN